MTVVRKLRASVGGSAVVVTYHRVHDGPLDPELIRVTTAMFEEHVRAYSRYTPMTAGALFESLSEGRRLPRDAVIITIDDGYVDCASAVLPVLERYGVPATVFVSSNFVDSGHSMWWDRISRVCLEPGSLPAMVSLSAPGIEFSFHLGSGRDLDAETANTFSGWDVTKPPDHPRQRLYLALRDVLHSAGERQRTELLDGLEEQSGTGSEPRARNRGLSAAEVRLLDASGLVEIGGHTVNHESLAEHPHDHQRAEIEGGKAAMEAIVGKPVVSFSYPYGSYASFTSATKEIVRGAGFLGACTTELGRRLPWGSVSRSTDRFEVPRTASANVSARQMMETIDKRLGIGERSLA